MEGREEEGKDRGERGRETIKVVRAYRAGSTGSHPCRPPQGNDIYKYTKTHPHQHLHEKPQQCAHLKTWFQQRGEQVQSV